jgi:phospholipid/cholesterol/gamma-HCH transport system permease protein
MHAETMISLNVKDNSLEISSLPLEEMSFEELQSARNAVDAILKKEKLSKFSVDLSGISTNNYSAMTFLIGCGELCSNNNITVKFRNLTDEKLKAELLKLGFTAQGTYYPKEFRKEKPKSVFITAGDAVYNFCEDTKKLTGFIGEVVKAVYYIIRNPRKLDLKEVLFYMDKSGADGVPIVMMICFLMGLILAFQGIAQMGKFGLQIYVADLVGLAIVRELGPLLVAMICIGRAGSAYAAELGTMNVSEEIDAMNTMGLKPARFLVIPKIIALTLVVPMLVLIGDISGIVGGVIIGVSTSDISLTEYMNRTLESLIPWNIGETLIKGFIFAVIIAAVGCFRGFEADKDAKGVGKAATSSVVSGIFLVIVADFFVTFFLPQILGVFGVNY